MLGQGRTTGQAVVDLDRVRQGMGATSVLNPLSYLRGRLPVVATGTIESKDGIARLQFESATVAGVRVPKFVLQQIVSYYSKSERYPSGVNLDDPFTAARTHSRDTGGTRTARSSSNRPVAGI